MSIDLLKKLVRLATNNPNEHEANLAARKACELLVKDDFAILKSTTNNPPIVNFGTNYGEWTEFNNRTSQGKPIYKDVYNMYEELRRDSSGYAWDFEKERREKQKNRRETKTLRCKHCKLEFQTKFQGEESQFECWGCYGKDERTKREKERREQTKEQEATEWLFNPSNMTYFNVRTGETMSSTEFHIKYGKGVKW